MKMNPRSSWPSMLKWCGHWFVSVVWWSGWFPMGARRANGGRCFLQGHDMWVEKGFIY
jgi:hypothetical protein